MLLISIFAPFLSFVVVFFGGRIFGFNGSAILCIGGIAISCFSSYYCFYHVIISKQLLLINFGSWFNLGLLQINWLFVCDQLVSIMLIVITTVSTLVHIYSLDYMRHDPHFPRFMSYLSLFSFFMLLLVTSTNLVQLFLGWEGVGLASYLLINFWHTRLQANKSAIKAMVVNRIGDFGLLMCVFLTFYIFKSLDFFVIFSLASSVKDYCINFFGFNVHSLSLIIFFLFIGAMGKSAQLGLHTWLPDAMEGPTPVSALIHAATMVTAGIFVLIRFSPILEYSNFMLIFISIFGVLTAFFAATVGLVQNDLKRVVAYSTCSQLGYMVFALGMSVYSLSLFHLMNHAFFKALLFLASGCVIHAVGDEQDMRRMGGLINVLPFTYISIFIGSFSLMGFPFLTGYYSKDLILEVAASIYTISGVFVYWFSVTSAFFTAFYSIRLLCLTFIIKPNGFYTFFKIVHEAPVFMMIPLVILSFGSIFVGYIFKDFFFGLGSFFEFNSIFINLDHVINLQSEFLPFYIKLIPVIFSLTGAFISYFIYKNYNIFYFKFDSNFFFVYFIKKLFFFFNKKWYFDVIYNHFFVKTVLSFGYNVGLKLLDKGFFEFFGPSGLIFIFKNFEFYGKFFQSGFIYHYTSLIMLGLFWVLTYFFIFIDFKIYFIFIFFILFSIFKSYKMPIVLFTIKQIINDEE